MEKRSKAIFALLIVLILVSVAFTYKRSFIDKDYEIYWDDYEEIVEEAE